jgi:hypothetical protein
MRSSCGHRDLKRNQQAWASGTTVRFWPPELSAVSSLRAAAPELFSAISDRSADRRSARLLVQDSTVGNDLGETAAQLAEPTERESDVLQLSPATGIPGSGLGSRRRF